ncbi:MAG: hypothetical protein ACRC35_13980 [Angustibacter sp.]
MTDAPDPGTGPAPHLSGDPIARPTRTPDQQLTRPIQPPDQQVVGRRAAIARWTCGGIGVACLVIAVRLVLDGGAGAAPRAVAPWLVAVLVAHDAVLAPLTLAAGWAATRVVPAGVRAAVQAWSLVSACLVLVAAPLVVRQLRAGPAQAGANPSAEPLDYPRNLAVTIGIAALAWAICVTALLMVRTTRRRRARRAPRSA